MSADDMNVGSLRQYDPVSDLILARLGGKIGISFFENVKELSAEAGRLGRVTPAGARERFFS